MRVDILSLFPNYFKGPFDESILKRAINNKLIEINLIDIRDFAQNQYKQVDDRPYGGGPGMVLMAEPLVKAIRSVKKKDSHVIYLSPQGIPLDQTLAEQFVTQDHLILICGHYEGIDERVIELMVDQEVSIGNYVLSNGALAACVLVDVIARFIPGVLGHPESAKQDSFSNELLDCPHYTRPQEFEGLKVPDVLLSGHHNEIEGWRQSMAEEQTKMKRPDLIKK